MRVIVRPDISEAVGRFADDLAPRRLEWYQKRNRHATLEIVRRNIYEGKMGEWAAAHIHGGVPDMTIYDSPRFGPDILGYGVKTCPSRTTKRYGTSWTFQVADDDGNPRSTDPIREPTVFVAEISDGVYEVISKPVPPQVVKSVWTYPQEEGCKKSKRVVYMSDIPEEYLIGDTGEPRQQRLL